jgi:hypothetical protein
MTRPEACTPGRQSRSAYAEDLLVDAAAPEPIIVAQLGFTIG